MATTASVFSISVRSLFAALLLCILPFPPAAAAHEARIVIEYEYSDARDFHEGLAAVKSNDAWGYIDNLGRIVVPFVHRIPEAGDFSEGLAFVGDRFIDTDGRPGGKDLRGRQALLPGAGRRAERRTVGLHRSDGQVRHRPLLRGGGLLLPGAGACADGRALGLHRRGRTPEDPRPVPRGRPLQRGPRRGGDPGPVRLHRPLGEGPRQGLFRRGRALRERTGPRQERLELPGYVDARGKTVIPHRYNAARAFREGLAPVATDSRWGYIDVLGRMVLDALYDEARPFHEGLAAVRQEDRWGYIRVR